MIVIQGVSKRYASGSGPLLVLQEISFSANKGEFVSIIGPSGCGKSTLIKIIGDILEPTSGSVSVNGFSSREARLKGMFSYVFQNPVLLPWRLVQEPRGHLQYRMRKVP